MGEAQRTEQGEIMASRTGLVAFWKNYDRKLYLKAAQLADEISHRGGGVDLDTLGALAWQEHLLNTGKLARHHRSELASVR